MFERITNYFKGVRYRMFPITNINQALGVHLELSAPMSSAIQNWVAMLEEESFLHLPASIAAELARLTTIESEIGVSGSARADFLSEQLGPVRDKLRIQCEFGVATGGLVMKPYIDGHNISVDFTRADRIFPVAFDSSEKLSAVIFLDEIERDGKLYRRLEYHHIEPQGCVIENKAFMTYRETGSNVLGMPVDLKQIPEWASITPYALIQSVDRLLLGYFKMPLANTIDSHSAMGVSVYARAEELIRQAEEQWGRILWEYEGTELAIHADETLFRQDRNHRPALPKGKDRLYRLIAGDFGEGNKL